MPTKQTALKAITFDNKKRVLRCQGDWILADITQLKSEMQEISWPAHGDISFDGSDIQIMDSAGAWLIIEWQHRLEKKKVHAELVNFSEQHTKLISLIAKQLGDHDKKLPKTRKPKWVEKVGKLTVAQWQELILYLSFIGKLTFEYLRLLGRMDKFRWRELTHIVYTTGYQALPIIGLLSFMIGVVIAYQMGAQLKNYGANMFIVNLLGLSVLREFGPLLTAIMVAGRTGSAFTAQIGTMKINQEIDALNTMGVTPGELLLLPRIFGLFIALPLLAMWADIFGIFGGMVMANAMFSITPYEFLVRFAQEIPLRAFLIGIGKAPVFALLIASIGCFEGMMVGGSADSVGKQTTRSVVLSIFFIIVADAIFSVIFSRLKL